MSNYTDWQMEFIEKPDLPKWVRVSSTGCPKKTHFQNAVGATVHWLNHKEPAPLVSGN